MFKFKGVTFEKLEEIAGKLQEAAVGLTIIQLRGCGEDMLCIEFQCALFSSSHRSSKSLTHALGAYLKGMCGDNLVGWDVSSPLYTPAQ